MGVLLVLSIPVVGAILLKDLESVGMDGFAICVQPFLPRSDAVVSLSSGVSCCEYQEGDDTHDDSSCLHLSPNLFVRLFFFCKVSWLFAAGKGKNVQFFKIIYKSALWVRQF